MKANDVVLGEVYELKVGNRTTQVKVVLGYPEGGWEAVSEKSGKTLRIKSADRLKALRKPKAEKAIPVEVEPMVAEAEEAHTEEVVMDALLGSEGRKMHLDEIVKAVNLPVGNVSAALMLLELKRRVKQLPGKVFEVVAEAGTKKAPIAKTIEVKAESEPHAFCCGCGRQLENRMKWYCGDDCKRMAKQSGVRYCWNCGKKVEKGMTCENC
jgi:hypothetical protein